MNYSNCAPGQSVSVYDGFAVGGDVRSNDTTSDGWLEGQRQLCHPPNTEPPNAHQWVGRKIRNIVSWTIWRCLAIKKKIYICSMLLKPERITKFSQIARIHNGKTDITLVYNIILYGSSTHRNALLIKSILVFFSSVLIAKIESGQFSCIAIKKQTQSLRDKRQCRGADRMRCGA